MRSPRSLLSAALSLSCLAACGGDDPTPPASSAPTTVTISMFPEAFSPPSAVLAQHGTAVFDFPPSVDHNVNFPRQANGQPIVAGAPADIPTSSANRGTKITRRFDTAGTFTFDCTVHPGMTGEIIVVP